MNRRMLRAADLAARVATCSPGRWGETSQAIQQYNNEMRIVMPALRRGGRVIGRPRNVVSPSLHRAMQIVADQVERGERTPPPRLKEWL